MVLKFIHKDIHRYIYFYSLLLMAASLPLSKFTLSVGEIALVANWILEGKFRQKAAIFKKHKSLWILVSFYAVLLIGMLYSKDWAFGIRYLRIELPILLIIPVIATSEKLSGNQLKIVLLTFCAAVFINTLISASILFGIIDYTYTDIRDISVFISHIRFSLMIVLTIFILSYFLFLKKSNLYEKILYPLVIAWLITSLFLFKTMTGIIIFLIIATTSIIYYSIRRRNLFIRISVIFIIISLFSYIVFYILQINKNLYPKNENINNELRVKTENGNTYTHFPQKKQVENKNYVWINICEKELKKEWEERSEIPYHGKDIKGQPIRKTIIRYLTSKGLTKDSAGIGKLSEKDIQFIESGITNYRFTEKWSLYQKIYETIWQIKQFKEKEYPGSYSVAMRFFYLKTAFYIIQNNFWKGVGTGDIKTAYHDYYSSFYPGLKKKYRGRAHNQFVTFFVGFGILGFIWLSFSLIYPAIREKGFNNYLFLAFFLIVFLSMLNEDTLETHIGASFFAVFYGLLLYGYKKE